MVLPIATPVTLPVASTVAIAGLALLHTPPETDSVKVTKALIHTEEGPDIAPMEGEGLTVIIDVSKTEPQLLVTV